MSATPTGTGPGRILVLDDQELNLQLFQRLLRRFGYTDVRCTADPAWALAAFRQEPADLVILDLHMPRMDGIEVIERLRAAVPPGEYLPILVITADVTSTAMQRALETGAQDFLRMPFDTNEARLRIRNLLVTRELHLRLKEQKETLDQRVRERTREIEAAHEETLHRLARAAEYRDDESGQHTQRVGELAGRLGEALALPPETIHLLRLAAPLHDLGKIGLPDAILLKPGRLSEGEFDVVRGHPRIGAGILAGSRHPLLRMAEEIALCHHECWDGSGYPRGLVGEEIPLAARITAVADFFDALVHERPYKAAWRPQDALAEVQREAGRKFDPRVVGAFLGISGGVPAEA